MFKRIIYLLPTYSAVECGNHVGILGIQPCVAIKDASRRSQAPDLLINEHQNHNVVERMWIMR